MKRSLRFRFRLVPTLASFVGVALLLTLGTWQFLRFQEKLEIERTLEARVKLAPVVIDELADLSPDTDYRRAEVHGRLQPERQFIIKHRIHDKQPGVWLVSPLVLASDGAFLLVNRGWIPNAQLEDVLAALASERTPEVFEGLLHTPSRIVADEKGRSLLRESPDEARVALETFDLEAAYAALDSVVPDRPTILIADTPGERQYPLASHEHLTKPYLTSERHLGYAITWYTLAVALLALYLATAFGLIARPR